MKIPVWILSACLLALLTVAGWGLQKISDFDARLARVETKLDFVTHTSQASNQIADSKGN